MEAIPAVLERRDARVAAADLEGDGGGGKGFLQPARTLEQTTALWRITPLRRRLC
jgi:hypothetical protein